MDNKDAETQEFLQSMLLTKNIKIENGRLLLLGRPGLLSNVNFILPIPAAVATFSMKFRVLSKVENLAE